MSALGQKQTCALHKPMSALGHKRTHVVRKQLDRYSITWWWATERRHGESKLACGFEVQDKFKPRGQFNWEDSELVPFRIFAAITPARRNWARRFGP